MHHHTYEDDIPGDSARDRAPQPQTVRTPAWPGVVVHCIGDEPVLVERELIGPDEPADLRCGSCRAHALVIYDAPGGPAAGLVAFVARHQDGCEHIADLLEMAGRR